MIQSTFSEVASFKVSATYFYFPAYVVIFQYSTIG